MAMVFSKQRFDFVNKTTTEKLKTVKHSKKYVFLAKCIKKFGAKGKIQLVNKDEENEPEN